MLPDPGHDRSEARRTSQIVDSKNRTSPNLSPILSEELEINGRNLMAPVAVHFRVQKRPFQLSAAESSNNLARGRKFGPGMARPGRPEFRVIPSGTHSGSARRRSSDDHSDSILPVTVTVTARVTFTRDHRIISYEYPMIVCHEHSSSSCISVVPP